MKMKKLVLFFTVVLLLMPGCAKYTRKRITYRASQALFPVALTYRDNNGILVADTFQPVGEQDIWSKNVMMNEGDIVYLAGKYNNIENSVLLEVLIDGKIYKQNSSKGDTVNYVIVSGTIPYQNH